MIKIFIPFLYIICGYILGIYWKKSSQCISFLLINIFIPIVIFLTLVKYDNEIYQIIILSIVFSISMYLLSSRLFNNQSLRLAFSYYNIGWLGLPISIAIFGNKSSDTIIAAYVGGMLFGATFGIYALNNNSEKAKTEAIKKLFKAPPFLAFILAIIVKLVIFDTYFKNDFFNYIYLYSKQIMSILGMSILGIWLGKNKINKEKIKNSIFFSIKRLVIGFAVLGIYLILLYKFNFLEINKIIYLLILPILPIAANITVLEAHYTKTSKSSTLIMINTIFSLIILFLVAIFNLLFHIF